MPIATPAVVCSQCGKSVAASETVTLAGVNVCVQCKPAFLRRLQEGGASQVGIVKYQGFWIRVAAKLLDSLVLGVVALPIFFAVLIPILRRQVIANPTLGAPPSAAMTTAMLGAIGLMEAAIFILTMAYSVWMNGRFGATLGKMAIRARIVNADGSPIGYGKALGRFFAEILSGIILYIGYIMIAFDSRKRALHDHICGTVVVAR